MKRLIVALLGSALIAVVSSAQAATQTGTCGDRDLTVRLRPALLHSLSAVARYENGTLNYRLANRYTSREVRGLVDFIARSPNAGRHAEQLFSLQPIQSCRIDGKAYWEFRTSFQIIWRDRDGAFFRVYLNPPRLMSIYGTRLYYGRHLHLPG